MIKPLSLFLALMLLVVNAYGSKDRGFYLGMGLNLVNVGVKDPFSNTVHFKTGETIIGYKHNSYLGVEVRGGQSLQDESVAVDNENGLGESVDARISQYSSIYYRPELSNEIAKLYLLIGQSSITTEIELEPQGLELEGEKFQITESGLSYGIGFGLWLDERMNLNFEIKNLVVTDNDSFVSGGINADYRF